MLVSLCIISKNEEAFIGRILDDIKAQSYSHRDTEIILVDNGSVDATKDIMVNFKKQSDFSAVCIIDCLNGAQAASWNTALVNARGDIIIRLDSHARIPSDFTEKSVINILGGEAVVGGGRPAICDTDTPYSEMLLCAEESLFGSSLAKYRRKSEKKEYVSSVFHAAYKREVFCTVGGFNECLGRTEDNELHYRITKAGYKICLCPDIISYQYIRSSLKSMVKQKHANGEWIGLTLGICPGCITPFHFAPFALVLSLIIFACLALTGFPLPLLLITGLYTAFDLLNTTICFLTRKPNLWYLLLPFIFLILHVSYGIGTLSGVVAMPFFKAKTGDIYKRRIEDVKKTMITNALK